MRTWLWQCVAVLSSAALGCGGGEGADEAVCAGDRWADSAEALAAIADCTVITGNVSVTSGAVSVDLPLLTRIDGFLVVWQNSMLTRLTLPVLTTVGRQLDVSWNAALASLELPALKRLNESAVPTAYDLRIHDNALPTCQVEAIRDQLIANGFQGTVNVSGDDGPCAP